MHRTLRAVLLVVLSLPSLSRASGLNFLLISATDNPDPIVMAGFQAAADRWSAIFYNDVTVTLTVGMKPLSGGMLGMTTNRYTYDGYADVRSLLVTHANPSSAIDQSVDAHLPAGSTISMMINHTTEGLAITGDSSGTTPYVDNDASRNNQYVQMTYANARALGLSVSSPFGDDSTIYLASNANWDFNPADGITPGAYDFVGAATHEIAHALGFQSSVDDLDLYSSLNPARPYSADTYLLKTLDLFRYSTSSAAAGVVDLSDDLRVKYFSVNGGASSLGLFADGKYFGDGRQASHWKDGYGLGIMDPSVPTGQVQWISANDIAALDAIGWNATPEPPGLFFIGLLAIACGKFIGGRRAA